MNLMYILISVIGLVVLYGLYQKLFTEEKLATVKTEESKKDEVSYTLSKINSYKVQIFMTDGTIKLKTVSDEKRYHYYSRGYYEFIQDSLTEFKRDISNSCFLKVDDGSEVNTKYIKEVRYELISTEDITLESRHYA